MPPALVSSPGKVMRPHPGGCGGSDGKLHGDQPTAWAQTTATVDMKALLLEGRRAERRPPRGQVPGRRQRWPKVARKRRKKTPGKTGRKKGER